MFLVGLTGGIASGKSLISKYFQDHGVPIIDADEISKKVVEPHTLVYKRLRDAFGNDYFFQDGQLDRKKLGELIFNDSSRRKQLNAIVHPAVRKEMLWNILSFLLQGEHFVIMDIPLLFESKLNRFMHKVIVVACDEDTQLDRLMKRDDSTVEEASARIKAQLALDQKVGRADFVIDNNGSMEDALLQANAVLKDLSQSRYYIVVRSVIFFTTAFVAALVYIMIHRLFV